MTAPPESTVFRKVSLDRLASPEQLDQLMQATDPRGWAALTAIAVLLLAAIGWGVFGQVRDEVAGTGILVRSGGVFEVVPSVGGRVVDVAVKVGDVVSEGQVVARVAQEGLAERLAQARVALENLAAQRAQALAAGTRDATVQATYLTQQRASLDSAIAAGQRGLGWLTERLRTQEQLVGQGLVTRATLLATRQQYDAEREKVERARGERTQLEARRNEVESGRRQDRLQWDAKVQEQEGTIRELERQLRTASEVVVPQTGRILEVLAERGSIVAPGEPVLTLDLDGRDVKELEAIVYVPSRQGKRVKVGMPIHIAPSTVKQEEYGLMLGRVTYVSDFPATSRGMRRVLKNDALVTALSGGDAPYEVHADLLVDPSTASRYRWTSSGGPPLRVQSGTLAGANVEVGWRRPLELVMPLLRRQAGL